MTPTETDCSESALAKEQQLIAWLRQKGSVLLGFSGGVDSTYLAAIASQVLPPTHLLLVIGRSASYPEEQWKRAREVARHLGAAVTEIETDELRDPRYASNPVNRCFFCKGELWGRLVPLARQAGIATVIDGTNADDLSDHRPGRLAAAAAGVESPLAVLGFSKAEIRTLLRARGIDAWSAPSSPCLSSRIAYGIEVTHERLGMIERAESALRSLGFNGDMRVRLHGRLARVELDKEGLAYCERNALHVQIRAAVMAAGFERVAIDARGFRSGSLNVLASVTAS